MASHGDPSISRNPPKPRAPEVRRRPRLSRVLHLYGSLARSLGSVCGGVGEMLVDGVHGDEERVAPQPRTGYSLTSVSGSSRRHRGRPQEPPRVFGFCAGSGRALRGIQAHGGEDPLCAFLFPIRKPYTGRFPWRNRPFSMRSYFPFPSIFPSNSFSNISSVPMAMRSFWQTMPRPLWEGISR